MWVSAQHLLTEMFLSCITNSHLISKPPPFPSLFSSTPDRLPLHWICPPSSSTEMTSLSQSCFVLFVITLILMFCVHLCASCMSPSMKYSKSGENWSADLKSAAPVPPLFFLTRSQWNCIQEGRRYRVSEGWPSSGREINGANAEGKWWWWWWGRYRWPRPPSPLDPCYWTQLGHPDH